MTNESAELITGIENKREEKKVLFAPGTAKKTPPSEGLNSR